MDYVLYGITALFLMCFVGQIVLGFKRGAVGQAVHLVLTIIFVTISFVAARVLVDSILDGSAVEYVGDLVADYAESEALVDGLDIRELFANSSAIECLLILPVGTVLSPLLFMLSFIALNLIAIVVRFVVGIIRFILRIKNPGVDGLKRCIGAGIGIVDGLIIAVAILVPLVGITTMMDESVDVIREKDNGQYTEFINGYDEDFGKLGDHFALQTADLLGAGLMLDSFATVEIGGEQVDLRDEVVKMVSIYMTFEALGEIDLSMLTENDKIAFRDAVEELESSTYLMTLLAGVLSDIGRALEGEVVIIEADPPYDMLINDVIMIFATSNKDNLIADINTIFDVYFLLSDGNVLNSYGESDGSDAMRDSLIVKGDDGETLIGSVISIIESNEHTKPLVTTITKMTILMLSDQLGVDAEALEKYNDFKNDFSDVIRINREDYETEEEYKAARNEKINDVMIKNDVEIEPEVVNGIGDYIDENYGDIDELTDEQFNDIMLSYFDSYINSQE